MKAPYFFSPGGLFVFPSPVITQAVIYREE
jgi:hypothetical protein